MASFEEHCQDCFRLLSDRCEEVNLWMDMFFMTYGANHRYRRHHWFGVKEAEKRFGALGRQAAMVHILKDCGRVPDAKDWDVKPDGYKLIPTPDEGLMGYWPDVDKFDVAARGLLNGEGRE